MNKKLLITRERLPDVKCQSPDPAYQVCALYEDGRMIEADLQPADTKSILNNIYTARVKNVVPNLNAAFVEIAKGRLCYLPLEDLKSPLFTKKISNKPIAAGDELVVQVTKEAMKTKDAVVTTNLSFAGEYLVFTSTNRIIGVSSKIQGETKKRLQDLARELCGEQAGYGMIIRTNAAGAREESIRAEFFRLKAEYEAIAAHAASSTIYSCLHTERPFYYKMLMDTDKSSLEEVITDDPQIFEELKHSAQDLYDVRLYDDNLLPLARLYNIAGQLEDALKPRVWLKSGANIVIQPTEALTVIDVNSSKNIAKKDKLRNHYKINLEAAREIAVQLRLRNLSGIIIIDFIDLYNDELNAALLSEFRSYLKQDPVPVQLVDITKLGLVELTRKKLKKPLSEQIQSYYLQPHILKSCQE